ncbi:MAG: hypothetical protein ABR540_05485 [Acidimicrobiales bacterium]
MSNDASPTPRRARQPRQRQPGPPVQHLGPDLDPDEIGPEPWSQWREAAFVIARAILRKRGWLIEREGPEDLIPYVAYTGWRAAREGFDPARGDFIGRLVTKIGRQVEEVERQCRHDRDSEPVGEFPTDEDPDDPFGLIELEAALRQVLGVVASEVGERDRPAFFAIWRAMQCADSGYVERAADSLGWTRAETQRAWDRVRYRLQHAFPGGLADLGLV